MYDGHAGNGAAIFSSKYLHTAILKAVAPIMPLSIYEITTKLGLKITEAVQDVDEELREVEENRGDLGNMGGCTAIMCVLIPVNEEIEEQAGNIEIVRFNQLYVKTAYFPVLSA